MFVAQPCVRADPPARSFFLRTSVARAAQLRQGERASKLIMPAIRRAEPKYAVRLALLAERTFRAAFGSLNTHENLDAHCASAYSEAFQASEIVNPGIETFVCDDNGELIGYAQLRWGAAPACVPAAKASRNPAHLC